MKILDKELSKYTLRQQQIDTFEDFEKNEDVFDNFLLDIPVGSGKSLLAMKIAKYYIDKNENTKIDIITNSKILQSQYTDEFKSISNLWGREGYDCNSFPTNCSSGADLAKLMKKPCENCPYNCAKEQFMGSRISMTNMHMFVTLHLYQDNMLKSMRTDNSVLIIDEAHLFEQIFSDYISVSISERSLTNLAFEPNEIKMMLIDLHKITDISEFQLYVKNTFRRKITIKINSIENDIKGYSEQSISRSIKLDTIVTSSKNNPHLKNLKLKKDLDKIASKIDKFIADYEKSPKNWVLDLTKSKKTSSFTVQTVWAREHLFNNIFSKYKKIIFLSGTILSKELFCYVNGLDDKKTHYYSLPSSFPLKNRPIYYMPVGKLSYKEKTESLVKMQPWITKLMAKYQDKKGIVHTNSFELTNWIKDNVSDVNERFLYHTDGDREYMLQNHYTKAEPTVIISPSMTTGVDLKDDYGRFNILLKVPYPSLESNKNKARLESNPDWYAYMTVLAIIQAYGRCVRSEMDFADFIILDSCFDDVMRRSSKFIPEYVQKAIKMVNINNIK